MYFIFRTVGNSVSFSFKVFICGMAFIAFLRIRSSARSMSLRIFRNYPLPSLGIFIKPCFGKNFQAVSFRNSFILFSHSSISMISIATSYMDLFTVSATSHTFARLLRGFSSLIPLTDLCQLLPYNFLQYTIRTSS